MTAQVHPSHVLPKSLFSRLSALKKNNDHGECYQAAAQALGLDSLVQQFERINRLHARAGFLSEDLNQQRHGLYRELLTKAKARLSEVQYNLLYNCF